MPVLPPCGRPWVQAAYVKDKSLTGAMEEMGNPFIEES